jgi:AcrR family transcriptional regulator
MELAAEKSFASLSIQKVTKRAGLNRTTFYLHYQGMHELLKDCALTLFDEMRRQIYANTPLSGKWSTEKIEPYVESVFHHLAKYQKFYRAMLGKQGDPYFRSLFQERLTELVFEPILQSAPAVKQNQQFEITQQFFIAGFAGVATWWLEKDMPLSPAEASLQVTTHLLPDFFTLLERFE